MEYVLKNFRFSELAALEAKAFEQEDLDLLYNVGVEKRKRLFPFLTLKPLLKPRIGTQETELTDESPMPFSKYKGTPMGQLNSGFVRWLLKQDWLEQSYPQVHAYLTKEDKEE